MGFKLAMIGAGSIGFTRILLRDVLVVPEFASDSGIEVALHDINPQNLDMVTQIVRRDAEASGVAVKITSTFSRREALAGAKYVINSTRIGGLEAFKTDVEIPLKYGVDQCVGDTLCAGGIMYGQRNISAILDFCKDMREVSRPNVLFLSYANPNAMNTWAANKYGKINTIGLCHGVYHGHTQISKVIELMINGDKKPEDENYRIVAQDEVDIICAGINHQTWYIKVMFEGEDWSRRLLEGFQKHSKFAQTEKVRIDMLKRFGYYSTESNGHLSEYLAWYRKRPAELRKWIDANSDWIHGETAGYLRFCTEGRNWFETDFPNIMNNPPDVFKMEKRSHEHAGYIIESLETGRVSRRHCNIINNGCITNLPDDCVVEVPVYFDRNGMSIPKVGDLPLGCAAVCLNSINVQRLAVEAGVHGDVSLLKQAMLLDPLVGAVCDPDEVWQMTDEMLIAGEKWLPQYAAQMPEIKGRFAAEPKLAKYDTTGAARLKTRTVEELKDDKEARRLALCSDKGGSV